MADYPYRGNLSSQSFPFLSEKHGRTIVIRGQDHNFVQRVTPRESEPESVGIPQLFYCHNVMPTSEGYQSVGYDKRSESISVNEDDLISIHLVRDTNENAAYLGHTVDGRHFTLSLLTAPYWAPTTTIPSTAATVVTTAHVQGITYIYFSGIGCYKYDFSSGTLIPVTLTGLIPADIQGITAASGYMIAWGKSFIYWSSTIEIDPLLNSVDFVPSLATGASGGFVEGAAGAITCCVPLTLGFIVFTSSNAVGAVYSNNTRFPFNFRPIAGSGGLESIDRVSYTANSASFYAFTTSGIQKINLQDASGTLPEASDFLAGARFEDFSVSTLLFSVQDLSSPLLKKVRVVADRYLVLSYGITELTHAIVYDAVLERWGKLRHTHIECFEYLLNQVDSSEAARRGLGFVSKTGEINTVNFNLHASAPDSVAILGRYQYTRSRLCEIQTAEIENVKTGSSFKLHSKACLDGKNGTFVEGYLLSSTDMVRTYAFNAVGQNHMLAAVGSFDLNSIVLSFTNHGAI